MWDETIAAGGYASRVLRRGVTLRITDVDGDACVGLLAYNASRPVERLNVADTVKVQWNAYLGEGALLLSDMGRVLLSVTQDTSGHHDVLCGPSTRSSNVERFGDGSAHGPHPSARDRFLLALAKLGMGRADLMPNVNLFRSVRVEADGSLTFVGGGGERGRGVPGSHVSLRAEMDVLVVVANAPHVLDPGPRYPTGTVRLLAHRTPAPALDDHCRTGSPEAVRAFENTADELLS